MSSTGPHGVAHQEQVMEGHALASEITPAPYQQPIDSDIIQPDTTDDDDSFADDGSDASARSATISSSVWDYEYENGRRYHNYRKGAYLLPNDEEEQDRLDLLHHIFLLLLDGALFAAPIGPNPQRVLDVGTGTGIWAIDFADQFPSAEVIGTDLSPIQPSWVPPNAKFYIDDAESEWLYRSDEAFDFIHLRGMGGSIGDWDKVFKQSYNHLKPGGWLEVQEPEAWMKSDDDSRDRVPSVNQWQNLCNEAAQKFQKDISSAPTFKQRMIDAGFVDVSERIFKVPVGPWPKDKKLKEIGRYQLAHCAVGIEPYTLGFIAKVLKWSEPECRVLTAKVLQEIHDRRNHLYVRFFFVHGRKPLP